VGNIFHSFRRAHRTRHFDDEFKLALLLVGGDQGISVSELPSAAGVSKPTNDDC
jgi:hypothetical protein